MQPLSYVLACALFTFSGALLAAQPAELRTPQLSGQPPSIGETGCKPAGDGTFAEIVTTMASVLPPEQANDLLRQYCSPCMQRCLQVSSAR